MRYWPFTTIVKSSLMPTMYVPELEQAYWRGISYSAMSACANVAGYTQWRDMPMAIVKTVGAPDRRVYLEYPEWEDWARLERGGFVEDTDGKFGFILDALH